MTAANPKPPFRVEAINRSGGSAFVDVMDADHYPMARFYGPDHKARAEALAAEYEQTYGPEWVVDDLKLKSRAGVWLQVNCNRAIALGVTAAGETGDAYRAHICRLLNEHGGPQ